MKEFVFTNPHVSIRISVMTRMTEPQAIGASKRPPPGAGSLGLEKVNSFKVGDTVTIVGHPLKDGRTGAQLMRAILADGTVLPGVPTGENY